MLSMARRRTKGVGFVQIAAPRFGQLKPFGAMLVIPWMLLMLVALTTPEGKQAMASDELELETTKTTNGRYSSQRDRLRTIERLMQSGRYHAVRDNQQRLMKIIETTLKLASGDIKDVTKEHIEHLLTK